MSVRDVLIVGAGPCGLSAAIAAKEHGLDYQVLEQGVLVNSIYRFPPQMVFFTTAELLEIGGLPFVSAHDKPTRLEALKYYRKVVDTHDLQIAFDETVLAVKAEPDEAREAGERTLFTVETRSGRGVRRARLARNVVLAIGYFDHPVTVGIAGEELPHVHHYYGEPHPFYRQRVVVVGGGNSAAEAALELHRAGAYVTLVHRRSALKETIKYWVRPDIENRIAEGSISARLGMVVTEIRPSSVVLTPASAIADLPPARHAPHESVVPSVRPEPVTGEAPLEAEANERVAREYELRSRKRGSAAPPTPQEHEEIPGDAVFLLTGYRADTQLIVNAGIHLTDRGGPVYDRETFETNVPGLFVGGGAIAGQDTGLIFIENGRFHGARIIETIANRMEP